MPQIIQQFISKSRTKQRPGLSLTPIYITIHSTANTKSTAKNEADYVCYNSTTSASYHYVCDESKIYQVLPTNEVAWHAGDGRNGTGNRKSVAIEICETGNRKKAVDNAIWLTKELVRDLNIDINHIVQHHHWTGKNCPRILIDKNYIKDNIDWDYFISQVSNTEEEEQMTQEQFNAMMEVYLAEKAKEEAGSWSKTERDWAVENGYFQGDKSGMRWKSNITREEMAVLEYRIHNK